MSFIKILLQKDEYLMKNIYFSFSKIFSTYSVAPTDFTNDKRSLYGVIWGYIYTVKVKVFIKEKKWFFFIFCIFPETYLRNFAFIRRKMYSLLNDENDQNM